MVEVQAVENGVKLKIEQTAQALPLIEGDRESLRSVFTNLIINGLQAIDGAGGQLTIALVGEARQVLVSVSDTGQGIAPEHLPQVFEPYFSTKETGTGLGLAIVEKAVEDHGGTVSVESVVGQGTTFTVKLPITHASNRPVNHHLRAG
jgi:two-component system sensor histidine kinase AtoS